ncbi:MAG: hypothetical protein GC181_08625 [Bacteroidetes bacterium]|nr:hypothetical protein [Bacteroidota bacterium]
MTTKEIKTEIQQALNNIPDSVLQDVLDYLNSLKGKSTVEIKRAQNLRQILQEDKDLLRKLAE